MIVTRCWYCGKRIVSSDEHPVYDKQRDPIFCPGRCQDKYNRGHKRGGKMYQVPPKGETRTTACNPYEYFGDWLERAAAWRAKQRAQA
jgi:hypothetical protein